jgi:pimeloyl-ACP methyl ester carboxylesterase
MTHLGSRRSMSDQWVESMGCACIASKSVRTLGIRWWLLLHRFPEFRYAERHQIPALAAGYQVVAPNLCGWTPSASRPGCATTGPGTGEAVVGHDSSTALTWLLGMQHAQRVERLMILNAPHQIRLLKGLRSARSCAATEARASG